MSGGAVGAVEEQAEALGHGGVVAQHGVEARHLRSLGVGALGGLGQLAGVAHQHQPVGGASHGQHVGQRELARLVDHERVETSLQLLPGEQPGRPRHQVRDPGSDLWVPASRTTTCVPEVNHGRPAARLRAVHARRA